MKTPDSKLLTAFTAGILVGCLLAFGVARCRPRGFEKPQVLERFTRELGLDGAQKAKVAGILEDTRTRLSALRKEARPRFEEIREDADRRIREVLKPEQLPRFEKLRREMDEKRAQKFGHGPPRE